MGQIQYMRINVTGVKNNSPCTRYMPEILTIDGTWYCSVCAKNYNPKSKSVNLAAIYIKVCFVHFLSQ